jgi:hypothetical protein
MANRDDGDVGGDRRLAARDISSAPRLLTNEAVAAILGISVGQLKKKRRALIARGFPDYLPDFRYKTDGAALHAWLDRQNGLDPAPAARERRAADHELAAIRRELDRRARDLANGG